MGWSAYGTFVAAIWLFLMIPGPGNLALISASSKGGFSAGLACTLGVMAGDQILMWSAVAGLSAMLMALPELFQMIQWLGAVYLIWMGCQMLKGGESPLRLQFKTSHFWMQGFLVTLLNPKAIVFYMAFFPMFIHNPGDADAGVFALMALTVGVLTFAYGALTAWLTLKLSGKIQAKPHLRIWLERLAGVALIGFGLRMIMR